MSSQPNSEVHPQYSECGSSQQCTMDCINEIAKVFCSESCSGKAERIDDCSNVAKHLNKDSCCNETPGEEASCHDCDSKCAAADDATSDTSGDHCEKSKKELLANSDDCDSCCEGSASSIRSKYTDSCKKHFQKAFDEYYNYIKLGQCICHKFMNYLDNSKIRNPSIYDDQEFLGLSSGVSQRRVEFRPRCFQRGSRASSVKRRYMSGNSCCSSTKPFERYPSPQNSCAEANDNSCMDSCCANSDQDSCASYDPSSESRTGKFTSSADFEHTIDKDREALDSYEHVTLNVIGMTCTGCSRKMEHVLEDIDGINSINVVFVTGIAEFDVDKEIVSDTSQLISLVSKRTGFKLIKVTYDFQFLDISTNQPKELVFAKLQDQVDSIEVVDKFTYRVTYDPQVIGARSILSNLPGASLAAVESNDSVTEGKKKLIRMSIKFFVSLCLTVPVLLFAWHKNLDLSYNVKSITSLILASLVQSISITEFYVGALRALIYSKVLEMDMLIVISISAAYIFSVVIFTLKHAGVVLSIDELWETSTLLITLVLLGRLLSAIAKFRAVSSISMRSLQVGKALLVNENEPIDSRLLQLGDQIIIQPHSRIVTDGVVISGESSVDESMLTGESIPINKSTGDNLIAGTFNTSGVLKMKLTRLPGKNSITDIAALVENSLANKPKIEELADKVAGYFIPVVMMISTICFIIWLLIGLKVRNQGSGKSISVAITYSIGVLAISCPCAIGLAVPMVLVIAGGVAARKGVIVKESSILERVCKATHVVFDKTGTLTETKLLVDSFTVLESPEIVGVIKILTSNNEHPVSQAVSEYLEKSNECEVEHQESIPGCGIRCEWNGSLIKLGNPHWAGVENHEQIKRLMSNGATLLCCTIDSKLVAVVSLKNKLRQEAKRVIQEFQSKGVECHIVSGDNSNAVELVAAEVGIPLENTESHCSPSRKQDYIKKLDGIVLFCGDGTNDAAAVAEAEVGVQMGSTSEITQAAASVLLLGGLEGLLALHALSISVWHRIVFNFLWAALYNFFAILLSAGAFVEWRIPPAYSGLGEIVSVGPVIIIALSLIF